MDCAKTQKREHATETKKTQLQRNATRSEQR